MSFLQQNINKDDIGELEETKPFHMNDFKFP